MLYSTRPPLTIFTLFIAFLHIQIIFSLCVNGQQGCQTCYNNSICNTCQPGYLITTNSTCQQCHVANCHDCHSGIYQCDWCLSNYYLRFYSCNICIPDNCLQCNGSTSVCTTCYSNTGVNSMGQCQNCSDSNCQICSHNYLECTTCKYNHGFDSSRYCYQCSVTSCISCYSNFSICEVCNTSKGPSADRLTCLSCNTVDSKCLQCPYDVQLCVSCIDGYGVQQASTNGGICIECEDYFCRSCSGNYQRCTYCLNGTGVAPDGSCILCDSNCTTCPTSYLICTLCDIGNGLTTVHSCQLCIDPYCAQCFTNYTICQKCGNGTGLDSTMCVECHFHCVTCSSYNFEHCTSCLDGMFVNSNNGCQPCITGCTTCFGQNYNCSSCSTQYYLLPNNTCTLCPTSCLACFYNNNYSKPECTSCDSNSSLVIDGTPKFCGEYCGDSITSYYSCDNQLGVPYDGCNNFCQIQPLFNCSTVNPNICSYNGVLSMNITHFQRNQFENKFFIKVQLFPPLYTFTVISQQELSQVFCFSNSKISLQSIVYDSVTHELSIQADFSAEFEDNELQLTFQPEKSSNEMFFAGRNQNVNLRLNGESKKVYYYSSFALFTIKIISYLSYCIIALGWLACIIGFFMRKLQGLQAMFVLQFSWLTFVWLGCPLYLQIEHALLLKYSTGYNYPFIAMNTTYSKQTPYLSQFKLSTSFFNNFNLCGVIQIIGIIGVIIAYIKLKLVLRQQKQAQFQQKSPQANQISQKIENYLQETKQNLETKQDVVDLEYQRFEKFNGYYQVAEQSLMYATLFNLIYFTQCTVLLFLVGQILNVFNISCLAVYFLLFFIVILRYIINPHPCGYFRYSFNQSKKFALEHYIFFPLILITAVALLPLTYLPYLSGVPLFLFFLYNIIRKPYKKNSNNYRAALNLLVMCSFVGLRVFMKYWSNQVHNSVITNTWLLFNIVMLIVITLVGLVMMIWQYYLVNYKLPHMLDEQKKTLQYAQQYYRKQILKQLGTTKMNEQVGESKSILKTIVPKADKLVDYSNKLNNQNRKYQRNKLTTTIYQQQEQVNNNQLRNYKKLIKQNMQKQKGLQYETNNYGSNQKIKIETEVENKQIEKIQKQNDEQSQIKQIKERVAMTILKDQNKFVQYKAALEYVAQKTDYVQRKVDVTNIELYERAYEDI